MEPFLRILMRWGLQGHRDRKRGWAVGLRRRRHNGWTSTNTGDWKRVNQIRTLVMCSVVCFEFKVCGWKQQDTFFFFSKMFYFARKEGAATKIWWDERPYFKVMLMSQSQMFHYMNAAMSPIHCFFVSGCFEPIQPRTFTSGLKEFYDDI